MGLLQLDVVQPPETPQAHLSRQSSIASVEHAASFSRKSSMLGDLSPEALQSPTSPGAIAVALSPAPTGSSEPLPLMSEAELAKHKVHH